MPELTYSVLTTLPSENLAQEYLRWMIDGHVSQVIAGGAVSGRVVRLDPPSESVTGAGFRVLAIYHFPSRETFARYELDFAPALRQEGRARFGPDRGVSMQRFVGDVVLALP